MSDWEEETEMESSSSLAAGSSSWPMSLGEKREDEDELEGSSSQIAGSSSSQSSRCLRNTNHCCPQACCCRGTGICNRSLCPCGALRYYCRRMRLCGGPDPHPDTEALQPCRDRRCYHCFGPDYYSSASEIEYSEEEFDSEDSGFEEMY